jgi:predicted ribonuclease YlaK
MKHKTHHHLQLKTLITRISDDSKLVIEGDLSQCDKYRDNGSPAYTKEWIL